MNKTLKNLPLNVNCFRWVMIKLISNGGSRDTQLHTQPSVYSLTQATCKPFLIMQPPIHPVVIFVLLRLTSDTTMPAGAILTTALAMSTTFIVQVKNHTNKVHVVRAAYKISQWCISYLVCYYRPCYIPWSWSTKSDSLYRMMFSTGTHSVVSYCRTV